MTLRDAFTAIALGHRPTTHRVRSKLRPGVYHNEPACRDCEWTGTGSLMEAHAAHVADLQIAYLRDHLAQHGEELGMTQETAFRYTHNASARSTILDGVDIETARKIAGTTHTLTEVRRHVTEWEPK